MGGIGERSGEGAVDGSVGEGRYGRAVFGGDKCGRTDRPGTGKAAEVRVRGGVGVGGILFKSFWHREPSPCKPWWLGSGDEGKPS